MAGRAVRSGGVMLAVLVAAAVVPALQRASASGAPACTASTAVVTPLHSPDTTRRPFYADFASGSTLRSGYVGYELTGGGVGADPWISLSGFSSAIALGTHQSADVPSRSTSATGNPLVYAYLRALAKTSSGQSFTVEVWDGRPNRPGSTLVCATTDGFSSVEDVLSAAANKITGITASTLTPALGGSFEVTATGDTGTMGAGIASDRFNGNGVVSMAPSMDNDWPADAFTLTGVSMAIGGVTSRDKLRIYPGNAVAGSYAVTYSFTVRGTTAAPTLVRPVQNIASGTQVKYTGSYSVNVYLSPPVETVALTKSAGSITGSGEYAVGYRAVATNTSTAPIVLDFIADTPAVTGPTTWRFDAGSATLDGQPLADPDLDGATLIFPGPFVVAPRVGTANGTLSLEYRLLATGAITNSVSGSVGGQALDGGGSTNQVTVDPSLPTIATSGLPAAQTGSPYSVVLSAIGGSGTYSSWAVVSGALPVGIVLDPATGELAGTPTSVATAQFRLQVTDSAGATSTKDFELVVTAPLAVVAPSWADCRAGSLCQRGLVGTGGSGTYVEWSVDAGGLPAGMALDPATGELTGTPETAGTFTFTVGVIDSAGSAATRTVSLVVAAGLPAVVTLAASSITETGAVLNGTVTANGAATTATFAWSTSADLHDAQVTPAAESPVPGGTAAVTAALTGLVPETTYYVELRAANSAGATVGATLSFTTAPPADPAPTATSDPVTAVTATSATLHGTVQAGTTPATVVFVLATTPDLDGSPRTLTASPGTVGTGSTEAVEAAAADLEPATTYFYRVEAESATGTARGAITSFTTPASAPSATTGDVTHVQTTSAVLSGSVRAGGATADVVFVIGATADLTGSTTTLVPSPPTAGGNSPVPFAVGVSGLQPATTYHYRISATNAVGTTSGTIRSFTTLAVTLPDGPRPVAPLSVARVAGGNRHETAAGLARLLYPATGSARGVVLARDDVYADGLTGSPLALALGAPLLLTARDALPPVTEEALAHVLGPGGTVTVLGGTSAVSSVVVDRLHALGYRVERLGGPDRFSTATLVADRLATATGRIARVYVATGTDYPDALPAAAAAGTGHGVVLLTDGAHMPEVTSRWLDAHASVAVTAIGGAAAAAAGDTGAIVGSDRYATAAAVAARVAPAATGVVLVTGRDFPDGLGAAVYAAHNGYALLLVDPGAAALVPPQVRYLHEAAPTVADVVAVGGSAAVPETATALVVDTLRRAR